MKSGVSAEAFDPAVYSSSRRKLHAELRLLRARAVRLQRSGTAHALDLAMEMFEVDCEELTPTSNVRQLTFRSER